MCTEEVGEEHAHLVDIESRNLMCACRPCYLLFTHDGAASGRFRSVPDRYEALPGLALNQSRWDGLQIPVGVAFFFMNSALDRIAAFYPSPAGATESELGVDVADLLPPLVPDVEAVLVRMVDGAGEAFLVPIDVCYELVGTLRMHWRGFDGGQQVHEAVDAIFSRVAERAR